MATYQIWIKFVGVFAFGALLANLTLAAAPEDDKPAGEKSKLKTLSEHRTLATFSGAEFRLCRGLTALCPEKCGDSGEFAQFKVDEYLSYRKLGEYGDPKQTEFLIQFSDFDRKPKGDPALNKTIGKLKKGDTVLLSWDHRYGEVLPGNFAPTRPVLELRPVTAAEAAKLRAAEQKPPTGAAPTDAPPAKP